MISNSMQGFSQTLTFFNIPHTVLGKSFEPVSGRLSRVPDVYTSPARDILTPLGTGA